MPKICLAAENFVRGNFVELGTRFAKINQYKFLKRATSVKTSRGLAGWRSQFSGGIAGLAHFLAEWRDKRIFLRDGGIQDPPSSGAPLKLF